MSSCRATNAKQATALIDGLRVLLAEAGSDREELAKVAVKMRRRLDIAGIPGLLPCQGEAHRNPNIDNCSICAPRWGWVGAVEVVS